MARSDSGGGGAPRLTSREKVYWPGDPPITKGEMLDYYEAIAPVMLPHLTGRAASLLRCPGGVEDECFFTKNAPESRPKWVATVGIWAETSERTVHYPLVNDRRTLLWAANLGTIEFHISPALASDIDKPTYVVFDLDPGEPADASDCANVALMIRDRLDGLGLTGFAKSSGSKGIHVVVPVRSGMTFDETEQIAHETAADLAGAHPELVVSKMRKAERGGKVLIDWSQNQRHKATVAPYSVRARRRPWVSAPLEWSEVEAAAESGDVSTLFFEMNQAIERIQLKGDLFDQVAVRLA